ncbi:dCTP deaminase [Halobacteriales archaeon QS_8_65_32]|jgi:deoxycytidine triphosphate deaminase|nr:MAG: dCTP deaminase [Halobacteriales archaeon QS_8_65_32]
MSDVDDLTERVEGIVHEETQRHEAGLDLTVAAIYDVDGSGAIDFGGDELDAAVTSPRASNLRHPDDDYEWWELPGGTYLVEYNETLSTDEPLLCQPRSELLERGGVHPTLFVSELGRVPLSVPPAGLDLKENARVSTLRSVR